FPVLSRYGWLCHTTRNLVSWSAHKRGDHLRPQPTSRGNGIPFSKRGAFGPCGGEHTVTSTSHHLSGDHLGWLRSAQDSRPTQLCFLSSWLWNSGRQTPPGSGTKRGPNTTFAGYPVWNMCEGRPVPLHLVVPASPPTPMGLGSRAVRSTPIDPSRMCSCSTRIRPRFSRVRPPGPASSWTKAGRWWPATPP